MTENKEIIEKLVELVEIYLENAQMNEVSTEWQEGDIDFEEVLSIVVHDGLYDLNFTEEQTDEFLALYKALNQEKVEISEAKLGKEDEKGDNTMEKQVKPMGEKQNKEEQKNLQAYVTAVANLVDFLFHDYGAPWEQIHGLLQSAGLSDEEIAEYNLSDLEEEKKSISEEVVTTDSQIQKLEKEIAEWEKSYGTEKEIYDKILKSNQEYSKTGDKEVRRQGDILRKQWEHITLKKNLLNGLKKDQEKKQEGRKPVMEKMGVEVYSYVGKDKLRSLDQVMVLKDLLDVMWNSVRLSGKGIKGTAILYADLDGGYELALDEHSFGEDILKMKVKTDDSYDEDGDGYPIIYAELTDEPLTEGRKPKITKKPLKESVRLIYNPREKTEVKEKVQLSFDGEPLPVDIKESNTHTKLRLFKHK
jgi:hypothetical protein